jgi:hypothetical protein
MYVQKITTYLKIQCTGTPLLAKDQFYEIHTISAGRTTHHHLKNHLIFLNEHATLLTLVYSEPPPPRSLLNLCPLTLPNKGLIIEFHYQWCRLGLFANNWQFLICQFPTLMWVVQVKHLAICRNMYCGVTSDLSTTDQLICSESIIGLQGCSWIIYCSFSWIPS